MGATGEDSTA
ncbi:unnamed protein product [Linum tenue]|uniref:Uncharacterized protein n=1 Tax=Linum tenue TaxID=586396 RepID=A0AAV0QJX3_9ROSI|nr:unnamed protein product [Linum tenue]